MRQTLAGLTIRGRAFLTAGITAIVCAVVLGQPSLARAGALVTALPLASAFMLARHKYRLSLRRTLSPPVVSAGCAATVTVTVTNEGQRTSGTLMLEDTLPYPLGSRPRFLLEGVDGGWSGELSYQVRSEARGRFDVGPMTVRVADPFGLIDVGRSFRAVSTLTVTPRTVPLPPTAVNGAFTGSGDNRPRAFAAGNAEDVTVREYRRGDELRRVHWASSAHAGQLMVRREEQQWHSRATIFLDNRVISHRGSGIASSLEAAVSVAASVGVHLADRGFAVRLVSAAGEEAGAGWHFRESELDTAPLLESLAIITMTSQPHLDTRWLAEGTRGTLIIAVLGGVRGADAAILRRMRNHASSGLAVALDVDAWAGRQSGDLAGGVAALTLQGWRTVGLRPGDRLDEAWRDLGRVSGRPEGVWS